MRQRNRTEQNRKARVGVAAVAVAVALVVGPATVAHAATHSGTSICSGSKITRLNINAHSAGTGRWTNYYNPAQSQTFSFPGGHSQPWGAYQSNVWQVTASGFYSNTGSGCY